MKFVNAKIYRPDERKFGEDAIYFISADGKDWYDSYGKFSQQYKLCIEPDTGVVRSVSEDAGRLYPAGFTVVEVDQLPDGFSIDGNWCYADGHVIKRMPTQEEQIAQAERQKQTLLTAAANAIAPLQDAVDIGDATPEEVARLQAWKAFRVAVSRVNTAELPVLFPNRPENL